jgi:glucans biosynthesis protein
MQGRILILGAVALTLSLAAKAESFSFEAVRARAQALSKGPFAPATNQIPEALRKLSYTQYDEIHYDPRHALWAEGGIPFQVEFFLPGFLHKQTVRINEVSNAGVRPVAFDPDAFHWGTNRLDVSGVVGYAGFRLLRVVGKRDEFAVFLDASYFRMRGEGEAYGLSARGLALNTSRLKDEEFPAFREFWIRRPTPGETGVKVWALMDSPSVAGAFEFVVVPGLKTVAHVRSSFFPRTEIQEFGIAPLSSMFWYDQNNHAPYADFRPEVHDSDGLQMHTGAGEWVWRPLGPGKKVQLNSYSDRDLKGFGLMQRQRDFEQYQDLVARYELRPSAWIEPRGSWGEGHVQLVQLTTANEFADNIVAFWTPASPPKPGQELNCAYDICWLTNQVHAAIGNARATYIGSATEADAKRTPLVRFVVEFAGEPLRSLPPGSELQPDVHCGPGAQLVTKQAMKNPVDNTCRLVLEITAPSRPVDLQARLMSHGQPVTETWAYTWQP